MNVYKITNKITSQVYIGQTNYTDHLKTPVRCSNGTTYDSISAAAKALGTSSGKICAVLNGKRKSTKGCTFMRLNNA